jgi:hypothetical protein
MKKKLIYKLFTLFTVVAVVAVGIIMMQQKIFTINNNSAAEIQKRVNNLPNACVVPSHYSVELFAEGEEYSLPFRIENNSKMIKQAAWHVTDEEPELKNTKVITIEEDQECNPEFRRILIRPQTAGTAKIEINCTGALSATVYVRVFPPAK